MLVALFPFIFGFVLLAYLSRNKHVDAAMLLLASLSTAVFVALRPLDFPDDEEYVRIYQEIGADFLGSPAKYGLVYKVYVAGLQAMGLSDVLAAFAFIFVLLYLLLQFSSMRNKSVIFFCVLSSMALAMLVQMRQALALIFVLAALGAERRRMKELWLLLAVLAHVSVAPFSVLYYLHSIRGWFRRPWQQGVLLAALALVAIAFAANPQILLMLLYALPDLELFVSQEAIELGNTGVGGAVVFVALAACASVRRTDGQDSGVGFFTLVGLLIYGVSLSLPLIQRLVLPFYCYFIVQIFARRASAKLMNLALLVLLLAFAMYKAVGLSA